MGGLFFPSLSSHSQASKIVKDPNKEMNEAKPSSMDLSEVRENGLGGEFPLARLFCPNVCSKLKFIT